MTAIGFPSILQNAVWHTTSHERYERIQEDGVILPNPDMPDSERWKTANGPATYPYVRTLGGVSLFEFCNFEPEAYGLKYPVSMWRTFVPFCTRWGASVWLEIDKPTLGDKYISGPELLARWKKDNKLQHTIMPLIEAASLAPIPTQSIRRVFESSRDNPALTELRL